MAQWPAHTWIAPELGTSVNMNVVRDELNELYQQIEVDHEAVNWIDASAGSWLGDDANNPTINASTLSVSWTRLNNATVGIEIALEFNTTIQTQGVIINLNLNNWAFQTIYSYQRVGFAGSGIIASVHPVGGQILQLLRDDGLPYLARNAYSCYVIGAYQIWPMI